jgi:hypothetical protein
VKAWPSTRTPAAAIRSRSAALTRALADEGPRGAAERALVGERAGQRRDAALGRAGRDAFLGEPARVRGARRRRGQRVEPAEVVAADEVERAAVQPGDDERALAGQRAVDVGGCEPARARADREPRAARVLSLDGEQPLGDRDGIARRLAREQLGGQPLGDHAAAPARYGRSSSRTCSRTRSGALPRRSIDHPSSAPL